MPRALITIAVALCVSHSHVAAEDKMVVDMSKVTCGELTKLGFQDKDYCATNPRATVMSAAEQALGIKMPRGR